MSSSSSYLGSFPQQYRHSDKLSTMHRPHLCTLPAEIKGLIISEGMQGVVTKVENSNGWMRFAFYEECSRPISAGLLGTCRLLREETFVYLGANVPLGIPTTHHVLCNPLAVLPLAYKTKLQHIKVELGYYFNLPWTVESLPSLKTLHMDSKDCNMNTRLCTMFRNGGLRLADIVNHRKLGCLRASVVKAHRGHLASITRNTKERTWIFSITMTWGHFVAKAYPLSSDAEDEADEPDQVEENQEHGDHVIEDDDSEGSEDAETDNEIDSVYAEVLRGPVLVCILLLFPGSANDSQRVNVSERTDGVRHGSLSVNQDLTKIQEYDERGELVYFDID